MAENNKSKKAESLNDRHLRFLQNLSTPRPTSSKPSFGLFEEEEEEEDQRLTIAAEQSRNVCKASGDDSIPKFSFSGISGSDSSVPAKGERSSNSSVSNIDTQYEDAYSEAQGTGGDAIKSQFSEEAEFYPTKAKGERSSNSISNIDTQYEDAYSEAQGVGDDAVKSQFSEETDFFSIKEQKEKPSNSLSDDESHFEDCFEAQGAVNIKSQLSEGTNFYSTNDMEQKSSNSLSGNSSRSHEAYSDAWGADEEVKPAKVKIKGRRRLCKLSTRDGDDIDNEDSIDSVKEVDPAEPEYLDASDFDLMPVPAKVINENQQNDGASEIRDIMNDLSSRLDFLSIEKKHKSKVVDHVKTCMQNERRNLKPTSEIYGLKDTDSLGLRINEHGRMTEKSSGQSSQYGVEEIRLRRFRNESERCGFVDRFEDTRNVVGKVKTYGSTRGDRKLKDMEKYIALETGEEVDDDDDCVVLSGKRVVVNNEIPRRKLSDYDDADLMVKDEEIDKKSIIMTGLKGTYKLPGKISSMLYPHQRDGLRWLWSLHCKGKGGILGDDMGLGKTMQICGYLAGLFHSNLIKRALVVAPTTLLPHWIKELQAVGLSSKIREYYGTNIKNRNYELQYILQDKGVLLTTYDIVRNNTKSLKGNAFSSFESEEDEIVWDYMILDEGHLIKNPNTQRAKSLLEIPSGHRIIISGTPLQNNLKELWALFNFCCPELLGDKKWFKETYESFILRGNEKKASERERRIGSTVAKELREKIQPFFLRRLKSEVFGDSDDNKTAKLSKKNEIIIWLKLTRCQRQLYEAFLNSEIVLSAFDGSPLAALTILKKICDHPLLLTKRAAEDVLEGMDSMLNPQEVGMAERLAKHIAAVAERDGFEENHDNVSCKLTFILSLLDNLIPGGHSVLIFSQTCKMLDLIQDSLTSFGYKYVRIDGKTKMIDRAKIVDDFQEGNGPPIFLLTSQVGGLGLTLTKADRVIVVDPAWNPSTDNQSVDRAYRIGQKNDVIVYRLMTCGTVEEKIYRKQIFKGGLFKIATEHKEQMRYFSQQDLRDIFTLPKDGFDVSPTQQQLHKEHGNQLIMDDFLKAHVEFLGTLDIGGVSYHTLLFSKTEPVEAGPEEQEMIRKPTTYVGTSSARSIERPVDGAEYAFKPKDVQLSKKVSTPDSVDKLSESDIKLKIHRLSQMVSNVAMVSRLPDKGERLRRQIKELNAQLMHFRMDRENEQEVVDLDAITGKLKNVLSL